MTRVQVPVLQPLSKYLHYYFRHSLPVFSLDFVILRPDFKLSSLKEIMILKLFFSKSHAHSTLC